MPKNLIPKNFTFILISFLSGVIFSIGLFISGMSNPSKVLGFLDVFGNWDPSLIFVMMAAIPVAFIAFYYLSTHEKTLLGTEPHLPTITLIDKHLILGSIIFGIGWGLAGICPGPAILLIAQKPVQGIIFFISMAIGFRLHDRLFK